MDSSLEKSHRRTLPLAVLILALLLLSVFVLRNAFVGSSTHATRIESEADSEPDVPVFYEILNAVQRLPVSRTTPQPEQCAYTLQPDNPGAGPEVGAMINNIPPGFFAVVDLKRVLAAHESDVASPDEKSTLLAGVKSIVAAQARSRGLKFVFDVSAQTFNGTPIFVTSTNGLLDITDDVLKELSRQSGSPFHQ